MNKRSKQGRRKGGRQNAVNTVGDKTLGKQHGRPTLSMLIGEGTV